MSSRLQRWWLSIAIAIAVPWPRIAADANLTFNNPTAEAVQALTEVAQNGETTTLPDGTIVPIPDRSELKLVNKQMQDVCDDPANKWVLTIPHVIKCEPTILREVGPDGEAQPAVGIIVDREENIESVKRKTPSMLGGFPTEFWPDYMEVEGNQVFQIKGDKNPRERAPR